MPMTGCTSRGGKPTGLRAEIQQRVHCHPEDCPAETLFEQLGAYDASDRRFALFLEGLASADVRPGEAAQRHFVACVNESLRSCGVELCEAGSEGGYRGFSTISLHVATKGQPRNLIFASPDKPDLRFRDALRLPDHADVRHLASARPARPAAPLAAGGQCADAGKLSG